MDIARMDPYSMLSRKAKVARQGTMLTNQVFCVSRDFVSAARLLWVCTLPYKAKNNSPDSGRRLALKSALWRGFYLFLFLHYYYYFVKWYVLFFCIRGNRQNFPYTNRANVHVKYSFKTQHGRILIDPAILAAIGHRCIEKMPGTRWSEATRAVTRNKITVQNNSSSLLFN